MNRPAMKKAVFLCIIISSLLTTSPDSVCLALSDEQAMNLQNELKGRQTGERIAAFAEQFIGTPYDIDPLGTYVTHKVIVADERVDCMYLAFRAVELALSATPDEAIQVALEKRFHERGVLAKGRVVNYDDRFAYGEDMIYSGKWGDEITADIGKTVAVKDLRSGKNVIMLTPAEAIKGMRGLRNGDILFFIKAPQKALSNELVGHIGIVRTTDSGVYLIHASGRKGKGGIVKKKELGDYLKKMPFIGVKITRFP
ncbi:MAG: DUF1460 domain-containing protein [Nitrospirae bacterium]|nr:DUF1460 domain-containing protein [Nitrospirota bacterium]